MRALCTIGYEGASIGDFIATLRLAGITTLIDIRDLPLSRKQGFSKRALAVHVEAAGINYLHMQALGDPKPGREAARQGRMSEFRQIFGDHLGRPEGQEALAAVARIAASSHVCLLCFERDHACCHRSIVADAVKDLGPFQLRHIGVRSGAALSKAMHHAVNSRELPFR
jgi:uncharacterized protein (DUF488 family)